MYVITLRDRPFYLFGDFHYANEYQCDGPCDGLVVNELTLEREYLDARSNCINIDAAFYLWLAYNHQMGIETDFFLETPLSTKGLIYSGTNVKNEWLGLVRNLTRDKTGFEKIRVHQGDTRQIHRDGKIYISDLFLVLVTYVKFNVDEFEDQDFIELLTFLRIFLYPTSQYIKLYVNSLIRLDGIATLKSIQNELGDELNEDSALRRDINSAFNNLFDLLGTQRIIDGKNRQILKPVWELYKLGDDFPEAIDVIKDSARNKRRHLQRGANKLYRMAGNLLKMGEFTPGSMEEFLILYFTVLPELSSIISDVYTISRMLYFEGECIVFAGDFHITSYLEILERLGGDVKIRIDHHPSLGQNPEDLQSVGGVKCIDLPAFPDFAAMKDQVFG
ncbi:Hypothetical protein POVR1_LOCUS612 [uncultured virus]|nr:Hypothetical protein POVR1_LOCUS612 [uncultured virus]